MNTVVAGHFSDRLCEAIERCGSPACVGLDPVADRLPRELDAASDPVGAIGVFCRGVLGAVRGRVAAVKFQSACFERYGYGGVEAMETAIAHARSLGLAVILDAKRGDIGISAEHYAAAAFDGAAAADALTVSGYLGADAVEPFLRAGRGVFVLVRTSNPGSDAVQAARLADGRSVGEMMADVVSELGRPRKGTRGLSDVGAVVGATKAGEAEALRRRMPDQVFLVPGYGAQGGTTNEIRPMLRRAPGVNGIGECGVLVTASRSVIYPPASSKPWEEAIRQAAVSFADELRVLGE